MSFFCLIFLFLNTFDELVHNGGSHSIWSVKFLVNQETLEDCVACETEDTHEHTSDEDALKHTDNNWSDPVLSQSLESWDVVQEGVDNEAIGGSDEAHAENVENGANGGSNSESGEVLKDKHEGVPSGCAEVFARDGDLDICVFGNKLDESLKTVQKITCHAQECFDYFVILIGFLDLIFVVFEDNTDELDQRNQKRSESNGTKMVSEYPPETSHE